MNDPHLLAALHQVAQVLVIAGADSEANIVERAIERIKELLRQSTLTHSDFIVHRGDPFAADRLSGEDTDA